MNLRIEINCFEIYVTKNQRASHKEMFLWKPTEESNGNKDFFVDTPLQCLVIPLNSTNCDLFKTKLDKQLKERSDFMPGSRALES